MIKQKIEQYFELKQEIHDYFGYEEDWVTIPLDSCVDMWWSLSGEGRGDYIDFSVDKPVWNEEEDAFDWNVDTHYQNSIYTQRFLPKYVYRGKDYTMISCDPHSDSNKYLSIFKNDMEMKRYSKEE